MRFTDRRLQLLSRALGYLAILLALLAMASREVFTTPGFIYQGF